MRFRGVIAATSAAACIAGCTIGAYAQSGRTAPSPEAQAISRSIGKLRSVSDDKRGEATIKIAMDIRALPPSAEQVRLASGLANLATEGDFGHKTLQAVADTLAVAIANTPPTEASGAYVTLAQLAKYEHVQVSSEDSRYTDALSKLDADDKKRESADFTLPDIEGHAWCLKALKGKVVIVNFWATWCPPCRKEIPDLEELYNHFKDRGLVILGISDEKPEIVKPFVAKSGMTYPILIDTGRTVNTQFEVGGIPRTVIYGRNGRIAAEAIDMRTRKQLLALLAKAGLKD